MGEIQRFGPYKIHSDVDDDGEPLDHWRLIHQSIVVEAIGLDGLIHSCESRVGLDVEKDSELMENFFLAAESMLKHRMTQAGVWDGN